MKETKQYPALGRKAKRKGPNTWRVGLLALLLLVISHCSLLTVKAQDTPFSNKFPTDLNSQDSLGRTKDNAQTTLNGSIGSSSASLTVMNGAVFPSSGFSLQIDNEILLCTTRSSNSISGCLRGQGGTSATVHASGAVVREPILTIHRDVLVNDLLTIEAKIGKGSSNASDAFSNYCLRKNGSGDTIWAPCADASSQVLSFNSRVGAVTLTAADVNALSGLTINCAACTGITGATGGVSNTGSTTIGADTDANGSGIIALQTRNLDRLRVENNGSTVLKAATGTGTGAGPSLRLTTYQNTAPIELSTLDFGFANGPPGDLDYINQTFILGYNSINGSKQVAGLVNFGLAHESKFRNGTRNVGTPGDFQTEIYYSWTDPTGAISVRPWALTIQHLTGNNAFTMQGEIYFLRQAANGGTQWGLWHENGALDLSLTTGGSITFKNNVQALVLAAGVAMFLWRRT